MSPDPHPQHRALREASQWYARLGDDQVSADTRRAWREWLAASEANSAAWQRIESVSRRFDGLRSAGSSLPVGETLNRLQQRRLGRRNAMKCVALLGVSVAAGWLAAPRDHWLADERTAVGEVRQLSLADGNRLWLNTDSSVDLSPPEGARRQLKVNRGDVFVDVAPGGSSLRVSTAAAELQCYGGRFAVRSGGEPRGELLAVYEGVVRLRNQRGDEREVQAGQQCLIHRDALGDVVAAEPRHEAWTRHLLLAHDEPLAALLAELARYRHGIIHVDPGVAALRVTGSFPTANTDMALEMLGASLPIQVDFPLPWWVNVSAA